MRVLILTAVEAEARIIEPIDDVVVIAGGIGRTNAAAAVTEGILTQGPFDAVINAGVAGVLPTIDAQESGRARLGIGEVVVASECVYAEEGLITPTGFGDMRALGFSLGSFEGNVVPVSPDLLARLRRQFPAFPIATVATCSAEDSRAWEIAKRTGAVAEAMEGAAVVHAARRLGVSAIEVRAISNTTGDRDAQKWDLAKALRSLATAVPNIVRALRA